MSEPVPPRPSRDLATVGDLHRAAEAQADREAAAQAEARTKRLKGYIWATVGIVVATVVITSSTLGYAQSAIDGGAAKAVAPVAARVDRVEDDVKDLKRDVREVKAVQQQEAIERARQTVMLEQLSARFGQPIPPPAPKVDGVP